MRFSKIPIPCNGQIPIMFFTVIVNLNICFLLASSTHWRNKNSLPRPKWGSCLTFQLSHCFHSFVHIVKNSIKHYFPFYLQIFALCFLVYLKIFIVTTAFFFLHLARNVTSGYLPNIQILIISLQLRVIAEWIKEKYNLCALNDSTTYDLKTNHLSLEVYNNLKW